MPHAEPAAAWRRRRGKNARVVLGLLAIIGASAAVR